MDLGFLGKWTSLVHCVWASEQDLDTISETGASIVHCPISNLKLGSGIAPLESILHRGINVALGTDNTSCNDSQNVFEVMKLAALLPKIGHGDFSGWPQAVEIFQMATGAGARMLGMNGQVGTLLPGSRADLTILNLNTLSFLPLGKMEQNLVYSENGRSVESVMVNGQMVLRDRKLVRVNQSDLFQEIVEAAERLKRDHHSVFEKAQEIYPYFEKAYFRCQDQFKGLQYARPL